MKPTEQEQRKTNKWKVKERRKFPYKNKYNSNKHKA